VQDKISCAKCIGVQSTRTSLQASRGSNVCMMQDILCKMHLEYNPHGAMTFLVRMENHHSRLLHKTLFRASRSTGGSPALLSLLLTCLLSWMATALSGASTFIFCALAGASSRRMLNCFNALRMSLRLTDPFNVQGWMATAPPWRCNYYRLLEVVTATATACLSCFLPHGRRDFC
jgi:hypothetical protein